MQFSNSHISSLIISFLCECCLLRYYQSWGSTGISYFRSEPTENVIDCSRCRVRATANFQLSECSKEEAGWWWDNSKSLSVLFRYFCLQNSPGLLRQCLTAGTAACFADLVTFPLDTVKVRQQVQGEMVTAGTGAGVRSSRNILGTVVSITR